MLETASFKTHSKWHHVQQNHSKTNVTKKNYSFQVNNKNKAHKNAFVNK